MDDLAFQPLSDDQIQAICAAMGVPSPLMGGSITMSVSEGLFLWVLLEAIQHATLAPSAPATARGDTEG